MSPPNKFNIGNVLCGGDLLFLISGPCVVESEDIMMRTAEKLKEITDRNNIPFIFKSSFMKDNRSDLKYFHGPGIDEGLRILKKIKDEFDVPVLTDVHYPDQVEAIADVVDVIQIPAYLCMQSTLIVTVAKTKLPVNIKHGQFLSPENMDKPVKKVLDSGNSKIILTERGYTFGYNDLVVDPRSFYEMRKIGFPVVFDITHSIRKYGIPSSNPQGGAKKYLDTIAKAGVASGVDGVFIETHPNPQNALCDAASQLSLNEIENFILPLMEFHNLEIKYRNKI